MTTSIDTEKFIQDIYEKPIIWNRNCISNKSLTEVTWVKLARKYLSSVSQLKSKWKGLRDMFRVEIKRIPRNESADHMRSRNAKTMPIDSLDKKNFDPYCTNGSVTIESEMEPQNLMTVKEEIPEQIVKQSGANKRKNFDDELSPASPINTLPPSVNVASLIQSNDNHHLMPKKRIISALDIQPTAADTPENNDRIINDDYHFLLSLQPFMAELSPIQKLRLRMKIQKLVFDELYADENL